MPADFKMPLTFKGRTVHVHGTAAQVEFENEGDTTRRVWYRGWGTVVRALSQTAWVHVPFPVDVDWTQGVLSGGRQEGLGRLVQIGAFWEFQFDGQAGFFLGDVDLWDGPNLIARRQENSKPKGFTAGARDVRWDIFHTIKQSLGMSIGIGFGSDVDGIVPLGVFTLFSAYAVFE